MTSLCVRPSIRHVGRNGEGGIVGRKSLENQQEKWKWGAEVGRGWRRSSRVELKSDVPTIHFCSYITSEPYNIMSLLVFSSIYVSFSLVLFLPLLSLVLSRALLLSLLFQFHLLLVSFICFCPLLLSSCLVSRLFLSCLFSFSLISSYSLLPLSHLVLLCFCLFSVSCHPLIYPPVSSPLIFHFLSLLLFSSYSLLVLSLVLIPLTVSFFFLPPLGPLSSCPHYVLSLFLILLQSHLLSFSSLLSHLVLLSFCLLFHPVLSCSLLVSSIPVSSVLMLFLLCVPSLLISISLTLLDLLLVSS